LPLSIEVDRREDLGEIQRSEALGSRELNRQAPDFRVRWDFLMQIGSWIQRFSLPIRAENRYSY
jgi:hypothetical protein